MTPEQMKQQCINCVCVDTDEMAVCKNCRPWWEYRQQQRQEEEAREWAEYQKQLQK